MLITVTVILITLLLLLSVRAVRADQAASRTDWLAGLRLIEGRSFFERAWVLPGASTTLRDGLGPHFNARRCSACHRNGGRSSPPRHSGFGNVESNRLMARFDAGDDPDLPLPLGRNWQAFNSYQPRTAESPPVEGRLQSRYQPLVFQYPDERSVTLHQPEYRLMDTAATPQVLTVTVAPALDLVGLIDQVADHDILALADPHDRNRDGISGRVNPHLILQDEAAVGRFGFKARHPDLTSQVATAFQEDLGITSRQLPDEACSSTQTTCLAARNGRGSRIGGEPARSRSTAFEINPAQLDSVVEFLRHRQPTVARTTAASSVLQAPAQAQQLFSATGCAACHVRALSQARPDLVLYSDLLLHDMGDALADTGPGAGELAREWRTAPLVNLGRRAHQTEPANYLHDGRATSIEQAVLWHGGEALESRMRFARLNHADRQALLNYLESL